MLSQTQTHCVHHRLVAHFNVKHGSPQYMTGIVGFDFNFRVHLCTINMDIYDFLERQTFICKFNLDSLVQSDSNYFLHAIFNMS